MPRYYFDVRRNAVTERDPDGLDLPNATAARAEAKATAVIEMVKD